MSGLSACSIDKVRYTPDDGDDDGSGGRTTAMVTVQLTGSGHGTIAAQDRDFVCGATCTTTVPINTTITLVAMADTGAVFGGWSGADCTGETCAITASNDVTIGAKFDVQMFTVDVEMLGSGMGVVTSSAGGLVCPGMCSVQVAYGTQLAFTAAPDSSSVFLGWSGDCGEGLCGFTVKEDRHVGATFAKQNELVVVKAGNGGGTVTSDPAGIDCGTDCSEAYQMGTSVALSAVADADSTFAGWDGGGCAGTGACTVTMDAATQVKATFVLQKRTLNVVKAGNGKGTVTSTPAGINCGADCTEDYDIHTPVTLVAAADADSTFTGWSGGGCTGTAMCTVTLDASTTVTATFVLQKRTLTVTKAGNGSGTVTSSPTGINCGADCTEDYDAHTVVTLTAAPTASDSTFTGWSGGGCSGTGTCMVALDANTAVTATFVLQKRTLAVTKAGNGSGTVTSNPTGINCGASCSASYDAHTAVTLTATPTAADSTFTGWSGGGCSGTGTCMVTLDANTAVTATFVLQKRTLAVTKAGNGSGTVTSNPAGINCGASCSASYDAHTAVTLTATPTAADSTFTGWSGGGCSGTGTCTVALDANTAVTATFALQKRTLTVTKSGNGTVTATGINCGTDCTEDYDAHTVVALTATPAADSIFTGWSGGCAGTGTCTVTLDNNTTVTATFALKQFTLTVTTAGGGSGTVSSQPSGIACPGDCSESYPINTTVVLTASPSAGSKFAGWSGACTGTGTCQVMMTAAQSVTATFDPPTGFVAVGNFTAPGRVAFFAAGTKGDTAPVRTIAGSLTTLSQVRGMVVVGSELFVVDQGTSAVDVFPVSGNGNIAPTRRIAGANSRLSSMSGITAYNGEIYVPQQSGSVLVFPVNANGDVAPSREITLGGSLQYAAISNGELFVADHNGQIVVVPANANGNVTPTRTITGVGAISGIVVLNGEIIVGQLDGGNSILVFPQTASGNVTPTRTIVGGQTKLARIDQIVVFNGEIYAANFGTNLVTVHPLTANGDVPPTRTIEGSSTGIANPTGLAVF